MKKRHILLAIMIAAFLFVLLFIKTDMKFLFAKSEIGHLFSYFINLNEFEIKVSESISEEIEIEWNGAKIYSKGKLNFPNIDKVRYEYGENVISIINDGNKIKEFVFVKENNWYYHRFYIKVDESYNVKFKIKGEVLIFRESEIY